MKNERLLSHGPIVFFFFLIQLIGVFVLAHYYPVDSIVPSENGANYTITNYNLPFNLEPPQKIDYKYTLVQLLISIVFVVFVVLLLMKLHVVKVLRLWFFVVSALAAAVTLFVFTGSIAFGGVIAFVSAILLSYLKVFRPNIIVHNLTEFLVYPGIAAILVPLFNIPTIIILFLAIAAYDIYAVWHSGIMQKMAKYQIQKVRVFSGLLLPQFITDKGIINPFRSMKDKKSKKKRKIGVALLGGGDIIFPMLLGGVLLHAGHISYMWASLIGATLGLLFLITNSEKGKFYPAIPFILGGILFAVLVLYIFQILFALHDN